MNTLAKERSGLALTQLMTDAENERGRPLTNEEKSLILASFMAGIQVASKTFMELAKE